MSETKKTLEEIAAQVEREVVEEMEEDLQAPITSPDSSEEGGELKVEEEKEEAREESAKAGKELIHRFPERVKFIWASIGLNKEDLKEALQTGKIIQFNQKADEPLSLEIEEEGRDCRVGRGQLVRVEDEENKIKVQLREFCKQGLLKITSLVKPRETFILEARVGHIVRTEEKEGTEDLLKKVEIGDVIPIKEIEFIDEELGKEMQILDLFVNDQKIGRCQIGAEGDLKAVRVISLDKDVLTRVLGEEFEIKTFEPEAEEDSLAQQLEAVEPEPETEPTEQDLQGLCKELGLELEIQEKDNKKIYMISPKLSEQERYVGLDKKMLTRKFDGLNTALHSAEELKKYLDNKNKKQETIKEILEKLNINDLPLGEYQEQVFGPERGKPNEEAVCWLEERDTLFAKRTLLADWFAKDKTAQEIWLKQHLLKELLTQGIKHALNDKEKEIIDNFLTDIRKYLKDIREKAKYRNQLKEKIKSLSSIIDKLIHTKDGGERAFIAASVSRQDQEQDQGDRLRRLEIDLIANGIVQSKIQNAFDFKLQDLSQEKPDDLEISVEEYKRAQKQAKRDYSNLCDYLYQVLLLIYNKLPALAQEIADGNLTRFQTNKAKDNFKSEIRRSDQYTKLETKLKRFQQDLSKLDITHNKEARLIDFNQLPYDQEPDEDQDQTLVDEKIKEVFQSQTGQGSNLEELLNKWFQDMDVKKGELEQVQEDLDKVLYDQNNLNVLNTTRQELQTLQEDMALIIERIENQEQEIQAQEQAVWQLLEQLRDLQLPDFPFQLTDLEPIVDTIATVQDWHDDIQIKIDELGSPRRRKKRERLRKLEQAQDSIANVLLVVLMQLQILNDNLVNLQNQKSQKEQEIENKKQEIEEVPQEFKTKQTHWEQEIKSLKKEIDTINQGKSELDQKFWNYVNRLTELKDDKETEKQRWRAAKSSKPESAAKRELHNIKIEISAIKKELDSLFAQDFTDQTKLTQLSINTLDEIYRLAGEFTKSEEQTKDFKDKIKDILEEKKISRLDKTKKLSDKEELLQNLITTKELLENRIKNLTERLRSEAGDVENLGLVKVLKKNLSAEIKDFEKKIKELERHQEKLRNGVEMEKPVLEYVEAIEGYKVPEYAQMLWNRWSNNPEHPEELRESIRSLSSQKREEFSKILTEAVRSYIEANLIRNFNLTILQKDKVREYFNVIKPVELLSKI